MTKTDLEPTHHQRRILCVDVNEFALFVSATILRHEGYDVAACCDPILAAEMAKSEELDLAVIEYQMPAMNGAELAAFCRAANPDIKVILYSDWLSIPSRELALADLFVQKSDGIQGLLEAIQALLHAAKCQPIGLRQHTMTATD